MNKQKELKCELCRSTEKDNVKYGEFLTKGNIGVHTFCLYLTSNLRQAGADNVGILGFLLKDIRAEAERISKLDCCYCRGRYANIGCCSKKCRRCFHFGCGLKHGAENHFIGTFMSFCSLHIRNCKTAARPEPNAVCNICFDDLIGSVDDPNGKFNPMTMLQAPCCHSGWFHKTCLQRMANVAGYFFNCPLCKDDETFRGQLHYQGIFIPDKDADWELEQNAFADLLVRPKKCDVTKCKNKQGRTKQTNKNPLMVCSFCGSTAAHKFCLESSRLQNGKYCCVECSNVVNTQIDCQQSISSGQDEDETFVDICNASTDNETDDDVIRRSVRKRRSGRIYDDGDDNDSCCSQPSKQRRTSTTITLPSGITSSYVENDSESNSNDSFQHDIQQVGMHSTRTKSYDLRSVGDRQTSADLNTACRAYSTRQNSVIVLASSSNESDDATSTTTAISRTTTCEINTYSRRTYNISIASSPSSFSSSSSTSSDFAIVQQPCDDRVSMVIGQSVKRKRVCRLSFSDDEDVKTENIINNNSKTDVILQNRFAAKFCNNNFNVHRAYLPKN